MKGVMGTLSFSGELIHNHGVDGPYTLTALSLVSVDGTPVEYLPVAHTTDAYRYTDFFSSATPTPTATPVTPGLAETLKVSGRLALLDHGKAVCYHERGMGFAG